jgi:hypothetical protein
MNRSGTNENGGFLRQDEMNNLVASERDPITQNLMALAAQTVLARVVARQSWPIADFDLLYFMELVQQFGSKHQILKRMLNGEDV